jgi:ribosomal peptide maturation radical SAM protein 1
MPFYAAVQPSIQVGLLRAIARQAGFAADSFHLNLDLSALLGPDFYDVICNRHMVGEWLFSVAAFGPDATPDDAEYFAKFPQEITWVEEADRDAAYLSALRHEVLPHYIEDCLGAVDWGRYQVVGFSSTFQQNVASLALARRIKERHPAVTVVFGGANMDGEMGPEYVRAFPFLDYAVVGEGDAVFPALLRGLAAGGPAPDLPGLARRTDLGVRCCGQAPPVRDLDALPTPDYDEYFERAGQLGLLRHPQYAWAIPFESSRGCWWGQKHHCTFCGLNGLGMAYRAKSPRRVLGELSEQARKHRITFFEASDNILDPKYAQEFFTAVRETRTDYQFFYEVKANLSREQVHALYSGGVRWVQPGIESLSSHVLQLMRKGCTMLQNVRLLKWCRYYRVRVSWNLLWGFPGETEQDYREALAVMRLIPHLEPPGGSSRIWLERFAPYFFDRERFPVRQVRPEASYRYVYPGHLALDKVAYFFDYTMEGTVPDEALRETQGWLAEWRRRWRSDRPDTLSYRRTLDALFVDDNRGPERRGTHTFYGPLARAYEFCSDTMRSVPQVRRHLGEGPGGQQFAEEEVRAALEGFCRSGLMVSDDGQYFSLALPANPNW